MGYFSQDRYWASRLSGTRRDGLTAQILFLLSFLFNDRRSCSNLYPSPSTLRHPIYDYCFAFLSWLLGGFLSSPSGHGTTHCFTSLLTPPTLTRHKYPHALASVPTEIQTKLARGILGIWVRSRKGRTHYAASPYFFFYYPVQLTPWLRRIGP
ncbi:hypothetical protein GQ53DRAFT_352320 [Thozetella sp. PMI_491]|nr:hypothetical protein GQ53DRAFT_352320 [Thozetella sp. PMI_491]